VIQFKSSKIETQPQSLTEQELMACELAKSLREMFTEDQVDEIREELENDE
jgi:hypothetical protein